MSVRGKGKGDVAERIIDWCGGYADGEANSPEKISENLVRAWEECTGHGERTEVDRMLGLEGSFPGRSRHNLILQNEGHRHT